MDCPYCQSTQYDCTIKFHGWAGNDAITVMTVVTCRNPHEVAKAQREAPPPRPPVSYGATV